jgi:ubiquinone/menaquinone biosynthesis C-methylase UbiE
VTAKQRTHKVEKLARIYDEEILPIWSVRFGKMLLRGLSVPERGQVLDVACGTGYPAVEVLRRMPDTARLIAIDAASAMLDVARKKVQELAQSGVKKGVFFRSESAAPRLSFADDVYDLVVCNLGLTEMPSLPGALRDFARVTKPNGEVRCTLPLLGTFEEFYDLYREVLIKHDKHEALDRLNEHIASYPTADDCATWLEGAGLDGRVEVDSFSMLFRSSREFFFAPVIEYGPLPQWKAIAGSGQELQDVFWYIKEAIDAYFGGRAFELTVKAGCLVGRKREPGEEVTGPAHLQMPAPIEIGLADEVDEIDEEISDDDLPPVPAREGSVSVRTSEIDIMEIEELEQQTGDFEPVDEEVELDAFVDGKERPRHLDED